MKSNSILSIALCTLMFIGCKTKNVPKSTFEIEETAQNTLDLGQKIPQNTKIKKGVLENGMTYYLYSTDINKNVADYYIIQNVGSVLENDNQQGLAHFLEHMAFNGTEAFPGKAMLNELQQNGLAFGRDVNAYTGFDETVYNVNRVQTTEKMTKVGLQILHDWSNFLLLTDEEIDAERGVIKEEWRTSKSGYSRLMEKTIGAEFGYSKYSKRVPIGLMSIVDNFEYKALRDFYHDWYRTDLQAIAIIGDFDLDEMEVKVKSKFSKIPAVKEAPERYNVKIEDEDKLVFATAMDKEVPLSAITFKIRHPKSLKDETVQDLKTELLTKIAVNVLNERFSELSQDPNVPTLGLGVRFSNFARLHESLDVFVQPKKNRQQEAFSLLMNELNRAVKFGFTASEINRATADVLKYYESAAKSVEDLSPSMIVEEIKGNYLENKPMADAVRIFDLTKTIFENLRPVEVHNRIKTLYTKKNRAVIATAVKGNDNITEEQVKDIITTAENNLSLKPYEDQGEATSLMAGVNIEPGNIVKEDNNTALNFTTYTLSNGVKVHYKYVDKNKNDVVIDLVSDGGNSLIATDNLPAANILPMYLQDAGLGNYSSSELNRILSGKTAMTSSVMDDTSEGIHGFSTTKDVKTLLQLVHLRFVNPRFDEKSYKSFMQNIGAFVDSKDQSPQAKMQDSLTVAVYGKNHPVKRIINKEFVSDISLEKIKTVYESRFSDISDFNVFIVGDITSEKLKPLLENFIASIPTTNKKEQWKDNTVAWQNEKIKKEILMPMEDAKGTVHINVKKDMAYSLKDKFLTSTLGKLLQLRYTATLREEEGGTYGARATAELTRKPRPSASISVNFDCNPELVDKLVGIVHQEMEKMKNGIIDEKSLEKTKKELLKERKDSESSMDHDITSVKTYVLEGYNMELPENFEQIVNGITKDQIQDIANRILTDNQAYEIVFKPTK